MRKIILVAVLASWPLMTVIAQDPAGGKAKRGATVTLTVGRFNAGATTPGQTTTTTPTTATPTTPTTP